MANLRKFCEKYFGSNDFYDILNIDKTASQQEIKKAYYKLSLSVHPDRVEESEKAYATEKFKVLGKIHSILQDKEKRKVYDDTGDFDEESDDFCNWLNYWKSIFKTITVDDIRNYEKSYIGSETEIGDIKKAYVSRKGDMNHILEMVPFSNCESEPRIKEIVQKLVDDGEVEAYKAFFNESKVKKLRRHKKYKKESEECADVDFEELSNQINKKQEERTKEFVDMISSIEDKYSKRSKRKAIANGKEDNKSPNKKVRRSTRVSKK